MSGFFISWTRENGRTADLARELGLEARFIYLPSRFGLIGRYARQLRATRRFLAQVRPERVALMLPPAPALLAFCSRRRPAHLIFDLHTGFFLDPKWRWAAIPALWLMRRLGGTAVVTNEHLQSVCRKHNVPAVVLHDVIHETPQSAVRERYVLCPLSYANDEPVAEILQAARETPKVPWRLTGRPPQEVRDAAPSNVEFTGFVDDAEYARLVQRSAGVIALTTREHTMQRAGYEAFGAGVTQVTSDFPELREFYADSAEYTRPEARAIANAVSLMIADQSGLESRLRQVRTQRVAEQHHALAELRSALCLENPEPRSERGEHV